MARVLTCQFLLPKKNVNFHDYVLEIPELAQRLNICVSQLYSFIDDLKIVGFPIAYSRKTKTYYYQEDCTLNVVFKVQLLTLNETIQIIGGVKNNFLYSNVCGVSKFNLAIANSELRVCRQNRQPCKCW